jgi:hypothetical protein
MKKKTGQFFKNFKNFKNFIPSFLRNKKNLKEPQDSSNYKYNTERDKVKFREDLKMFLGNIETKSLNQDYQQIMKFIYTHDKIQHKFEHGTSKTTTEDIENKKKVTEDEMLKKLEKEREVLVSNFFNKYSLKILENTSNKNLVDLACKSYVGDTDIPKDIQRSLLILKLALTKCSSDNEYTETKFYLDYFGKNSAPDNEEMGKATDNIFNNKDYIKAKYVTSRDLFKMVTYNFLEMQGMDSIPQAEKDFIYSKIYYIMEESANQGIYEAYYILGLMHLNGYYTKVNNKKAYYHFCIAASYGHAMSYYQLYKMTKDDVLDVYKEEEAKIKKQAIFDYLKLSAEEGYVEAMHELGNEYAKGEYTKRNLLKALAWYRQACRNGYSLSYVKIR